MKRKSPWPFASRRVAGVVALPESLRLCVAWADGGTSEIDLTPWAGTDERLASLRDPAFFARAQVGEHGWSVAWNGEEIEIDTIHLQLLEAEGRGLPYTPEAFRRWREGNDLTLDTAAAALGISRRMVAYYESGEHFIPRHIALACKGWLALKAERAPEVGR